MCLSHITDSTILYTVLVMLEHQRTFTAHPQIITFTITN